MKQNSAQFKRMGLAAAAAGTAAIVVFTKMVKKYVEMGDMIHKMALRTGFAAETLSELAFAAEISGADLSMLEKGVKKMSKTIVDASRGMETYAIEFRELGLDVEQLLKMKPEEQFLKIGAAIADLGSDTLRTSAAVNVFGRAGTMLLPLFKEGAEGIAALREEAHKTGIIFDEEMAAKAAKLNDAQLTLKRSVQGLSIAILNDLIPVITDVTKSFTDFFITSRKDAKSWTDSILSFFQLVAKGVGGLALAWHTMQVIVFKGAEFIVKAIKLQIDTLTAPLRLLAKLPGLAGKPARAMLKLVGVHTADLTAISEGYNKEAEKQIDIITDIVGKLEKFDTALKKVKTATKDAKEEQKSFVDTVLPSMKEVNEAWEQLLEDPKELTLALEQVAIKTKDTFATVMESMGFFVRETETSIHLIVESWEVAFNKILSAATLFTSSLGNLFSQMHENEIQRIENEYQRRKEIIDASLMSDQEKFFAIEKLDREMDKKRLKAQRKQAKRTKALSLMEAIVNTASAVVQALKAPFPLNLILPAIIGAMGAAQIALIAAQPLPTFAKGGRLGKGEPGIVGEEGAEVFVPDTGGTIVPIRERARGGGIGANITILTEIYMQTIDGATTREFMRRDGLREIVEAIRMGIMKPELQDALRIK